jgi:hypothetical protein
MELKKLNSAGFSLFRVDDKNPNILPKSPKVAFGVHILPNCYKRGINGWKTSKSQHSTMTKGN